MNRYFITLAALSVSASMSYGQATLTASTSNPYLGDIYANINCDPSGVNPGSAGAAQTWHFEALNPITTGTINDTATAEACGLTAVCALFSGSDVVIADPSQSTYDYLVTSANKLQHKGYYNSATQNAVYTDLLDQFRYPFTYNSNYIDTATGAVTFTPSGLPTVVATEFVVDTVKCDGYGTLILPTATYSNVLRVRSAQTFRDSANVFGSPVIETYFLEAYTWYTPGYHSPLLTIATATGSLVNYQVVSYSAKKLKTAVPVMNETEASFKLSPNPATDALNISFTVSGDQQARLSLVDMMGREVAVLTDECVNGAKSVNYNTSGLPKGLYIARLATAGGVVSRKVEVR